LTQIIVVHIVVATKTRLTENSVMSIATMSLINPTTIQELSPGLFAFAYRAVRQRKKPKTSSRTPG